MGRCPDCYSSGSAFFDIGDGKCANCYGTGDEQGILDQITDRVSHDFFGTPLGTDCHVCHGSGECQTCGGTGEVEPETSYSAPSSSDNGDSVTDYQSSCSGGDSSYSADSSGGSSYGGGGSYSSSYSSNGRSISVSDSSAGSCVGFLIVIVIVLIIGTVLFAPGYLDRKTDEVIKRFSPTYETKAEKALKEKQEWKRWESFLQSSEKWLIVSETAPVLPQARIIFIAGEKGNQKISSMNLDGNSQVNLTNQFEEITGYTLSPDGKKIAFIGTQKGKNEIYLIGSNGGKIIQITNTTDGLGYKDLAWLSPSVILSTRQTHPYVRTIWQVELSSDPQVPAIVVLRIPTYQEYNDRWAREANRAGPKTFFNCESPSVSPDGTKLAYIKGKYSAFGYTMSAVKGAGKIVVRDLQSNKESTHSGMNAIHLTSQAWSPDSSKVVFTGGVRYYGEEIKNIIGILEGRRVTWLRVFGNNPAWSPDGKWIAFDYEGTIYALEVASGNVRKIVGPKFSGKSGENPLWVPTSQ